jgi:hypothetical protein
MALFSFNMCTCTCNSLYGSQNMATVYTLHKKYFIYLNIRCFFLIHLKNWGGGGGEAEVPLYAGLSYIQVNMYLYQVSIL